MVGRLIDVQAFRGPRRQSSQAATNTAIGRRIVGQIFKRMGRTTPRNGSVEQESIQSTVPADTVGGALLQSRRRHPGGEKRRQTRLSIPVASTSPQSRCRRSTARTNPPTTPKPRCSHEGLAQCDEHPQRWRTRRGRSTRSARSSMRSHGGRARSPRGPRDLCPILQIQNATCASPPAGLQCKSRGSRAGSVKSPAEFGRPISFAATASSVATTRDRSPGGRAASRDVARGLVSD
jgi:hypothetical protein